MKSSEQPNFSDRDLRILVDNLMDVIFLYQVSGKPGIDFINRAITTLSFYNPQDFYNDPDLFFSIIHPDDLATVQKMLTEAYTDKVTFRIKRKDGKIFRVEAHCTSMFTAEGGMYAVEGSLRIISSEHPLTSSEAGVNNLPAELHIHNSETGKAIATQNRGVFLEANQPFLESLGLNDELVGLSILNLYEWVFFEDRSLLQLKDAEIWTARGLKIHLRSRSGMNLELEFSQEIYPYLDQECVLVTISEYSVHQQMKRYIEELALVSHIGRTLAENLNVNEIYARLATAVWKLFPDGHALFISRFHAESSMLSCVYAVVENNVLDPSTLPVIPLSPPGKGVQSEAIHLRQPVVINDMVNRLNKDPNKVLISGDDEIEQMPLSSLCVPMMIQNIVLGVVQVQTTLVNRFHRTDAELLSVVANTAAIVLQNAELVENLRSSHADLLNAYDKTLEGWVHALDLRDQETEGHTLRVAEQAVHLANKMGLSREAILHLRRGALLHDIGKIGIPDQILYKTGSLDAADWEVMHRHPQYAFDMINPIEYLRPAVDIPYAHHEWWDGSGYPRGIKGEEISLGARIFALIDVWDALRSDRPYRKAWKEDKVLEYIRNLSGKQFDPAIVGEFLEMIAEQNAACINLKLQDPTA
jgi:putative nucleotidyltransferase with HDIG domain